MNNILYDDDKVLEVSYGGKWIIFGLDETIVSGLLDVMVFKRKMTREWLTDYAKRHHNITKDQFIKNLQLIDDNYFFYYDPHGCDLCAVKKNVSKPKEENQERKKETPKTDLIVVDDKFLNVRYKSVTIHLERDLSLEEELSGPYKVYSKRLTRKEFTKFSQNTFVVTTHSLIDSLSDIEDDVDFYFDDEIGLYALMKVPHEALKSESNEVKPADKEIDLLAAIRSVTDRYTPPRDRGNWK